MRRILADLAWVGLFVIIGMTPEKGNHIQKLDVRERFVVTKDFFPELASDKRIDPALVLTLADIQWVIERAYPNQKIDIIVTSAYRSKKHNKAVGGVENSRHLKGKALDIIVFVGSKFIKTKHICNLLDKQNFDELIPYDTHIHLAIH